MESLGSVVMKGIYPSFCRVLIFFLTFGINHIRFFDSNRIYPTVNTTVQYSSWAQVECGKNHSVALNNGGEVFTWGDNKEGQLGYDDIEYSNFPMKVEALKDEIIVKIRCGADFTVAISTNGVVFTWYVVQICQVVIVLIQTNIDV
jgi:hypothetical protein